MAGKRGAQEEQRRRGAGAFAEPHVEIEERREPERFEQQAVAGLGGDVAGERVRERVGAQLVERRDRGGADEAIEQNGNVVSSRRQRRAENGGKLAAAERRRDLERVVEQGGVMRQRTVDGRALAREAFVIDTSAAAGPAPATAAEKRRRERSRRRGIADAHFAEADEIGLRG